MGYILFFLFAAGLLTNGRTMPPAPRVERQKAAPYRRPGAAGRALGGGSAGELVS